MRSCLSVAMRGSPCGPDDTQTMPWWLYVNDNRSARLRGQGPSLQFREIDEAEGEFASAQAGVLRYAALQ
jgi:hypothetical protein